MNFYKLWRIIQNENFLPEMALSNFRYQWGDNNHFNEKDKKVIAHPKTAITCEHILAKIGYNFNILFLVWNDRSKAYSEEVYRFCQDNDIILDGHITFSKNSSSGDIMTPWMILHTIGHALTEAVPNLTRQIYAIFNDLYGKSVQDSQQRSNLADFISRIFKFKSAVQRASGASQKSVRDVEEIIHELVAEYLWHGGNIRWQATNNQQEVANAIEKIKTLINAAIHSQVDKIIVDVNPSV